MPGIDHYNGVRGSIICDSKPRHIMEVCLIQTWLVHGMRPRIATVNHANHTPGTVTCRLNYIYHVYNYIFRVSKCSLTDELSSGYKF